MKNIDLEKVKKKLKNQKLNCIKDRLSERGISQKWLAQKMNKTTNTLNGWCSNKVQPHLVDLVLISIILDCQIEDLIDKIDFNEIS